MASADTVSDELLAAYIDGNTSTEENAFIESSTSSEDLNEIAELSQDSMSFEDKLHFYDGDYGYWELGIPPVMDYRSDSELMDIASPRYDNIFTLENIDELFNRRSQDVSNHSCMGEEEIHEEEENIEDDDIEELLDDED